MKNSFKEWALDVTLSNNGAGRDDLIAFVPIENDEIVFGLTMIQSKSPGLLVAVVSQHGQEHAEQWVKENPNWKEKYER
jgi:hypothetical protein